jgi:hypothetical protein
MPEQLADEMQPGMSGCPPSPPRNPGTQRCRFGSHTVEGSVQLEVEPQ